MEPNLFQTNLFSKQIIGDFAVYNNSLLFRSGTFPERIVNGRPLSITNDQIADVVKNFKPVSGNIEHTNYLKGKAAHVLSVAQFGDELRGAVAIPLLLDQLISDDERKLSVELNPITYRNLDSICLCTNPRITDAMLMTAEQNYFKKPIDSTDHGKHILQNIHDMAANHGAICDTSESNEGKMTNDNKFVSKPESKSIQGIHDAAVAGGASCSSMGYGYYTAMPLDRTTMTVQPLIEDQGTNTHLSNKSPSERKNMKLSDFIKEKLGIKNKNEQLENDLGDFGNTILDPSGVIHILEPVPDVDIKTNAEFVAKSNEAAELKAQLDKLQAEKDAQFTKDNETVIDNLIKIGKFDPVDKQKLVEQRAANFSVFDALAELISVKPEFLNQNTVDAGKVRDAQDGKINTKEALEANKQALSSVIGL